MFVSYKHILFQALLIRSHICANNYYLDDLFTHAVCIQMTK